MLGLAGAIWGWHPAGGSRAEEPGDRIGGPVSIEALERRIAALEA